MRKTPWLAVLVVLIATAAIRAHLLGTPLERDEGEYAYIGQLMLQGVPPYQLAANMKLPGTYAAYAVLMKVLGQTPFGIHLGLLLVNALCIVLVALLGVRLFGRAPGVAAAAAYAMLSIGSEVMGTQAHATHFVIAAALGGVLLLVKALSADEREFTRTDWVPVGLSGLLFGLAFLMKQQGILFGLFGMIALTAGNWGRWRLLIGKVSVFAAALALPFAVTCFWLWRDGVFPKFWFWTFTYARVYASEMTLREGWEEFAYEFPEVVRQNLAIWILAIAGLVYLWRMRSMRRRAVFATVLLVFSFLAVCPGLYFRGHYFVLMLPAVALLAGAAVQIRPMYWVLGAALGISLFVQRQFLFESSPVQASRMMYGRSPFPEALQVANYIRRHSGADAKIAVLGSEPEIYFYSGRRSATSFIYMYGLMEPQPYAITMQEDMIREISGAAPEWVVEVADNTSWIRDEDSPTHIFDWWTQYRAQYQAVGAADVVSWTETDYVWGSAAEGYRPKSPHCLLLFKRKSPSGAGEAGRSF